MSRNYLSGNLGDTVNVLLAAAAYAAAEGIRERLNGSYKVKSLQDYHREIENIMNL